MRKQILFRRSCNIGKAQLRFVQISFQECIFSMLGKLFPRCKIPDDHEDLDSFEGVLPPRKKWEFRAQTDARTDAQLAREQTFFFLRLPTGQYGPVSQLSRSEERCTGPFNWGEAHCAGEKVKRKIGPFQWKSL